MEARIERVASPGDADAPEGNAWIVGDDDEVIVVHPGHDAGAVLAAVAEREILAVICTHGHAAHVAAANEVAARDESPVALHPRDRLLWRESHRDGDPEIEMEDGGIFEVGDATLEVIHAPGHSPGSVCLYCEELEAVFAGDALWVAAARFRTMASLPDFSAQLSAIGEHLLTLPGPTRVLPGHGEETTVSAASEEIRLVGDGGPGAPARDPD